ncbi:hypothetical protein [Engelhardtia mirabilis]|uniref:DUF1565 domain-containing protein n=1 Tax=Engelhardtia mirabilis TaxID=2528011 RepID=A0A518BFD0_9BACT|nr:hypothetical protein Pla133_07540 [Planctomycetes bacterium Pla133]QDV00015.1 hypothetical protein Pla86_07530 [Planctomycetes bacterium Pla86]
MLDPLFRSAARSASAATTLTLAAAVLGATAATSSATAAPAAALRAAGNVLVVDDDGGAGVDHTDLQAAIDASGAADTILVKAGTYGAIAIDGKTVSVVADTFPVLISGQSSIQNVGAGQRVVLRGLSFSYGFGTSLTLGANFGPVWLDACSVYSEGTPLFLPAVGMVVGSCDALVLSDCSIASGDAPFGTVGAGVEGLTLNGSTVHLYDTVVSGGTPFEGFPGGAGLLASGCELFASGCTFNGGPGGMGDDTGNPFAPCTDGAAGGVGLRLAGSASDVTLLDTAIAGGAGGAAGGSSCSAGNPGAATSIEVGSPPADLGLTWPARHYDIPSPIRSGQVGLLELTATPGELAWAIFSVDTAPIPFPAFKGSLALAGPLIFAYAGQVPAGGTLAVPVNINLPPGVPYALAYEQGLFFSLEDEFVLGTPRLGWVLASTF